MGGTHANGVSSQRVKQCLHKCAIMYTPTIRWKHIIAKKKRKQTYEATDHSDYLFDLLIGYYDLLTKRGECFVKCVVNLYWNYKTTYFSTIIISE